MRYGVEESKSIQTVNVSGGATTEVTITGLHSSTKYFIELAALNALGTGVYSIAIFATTNGNILHSIPKYIIIIGCIYFIF